MNIAEKIKKQTDKILRQQAQGPNAGVVIVDAGDGSTSVSNPAGDLAQHKTSGDHDGRYYTEGEVDALIADIPTGGVDVFIELADVPPSYEGHSGKLAAVNPTEDGLEFVATPPAENGIPTGGTNNQLLAKDGAGDYAVKWQDAPEAANGLPAGGTTGQVLAKNSDTDYDAGWIDAPSGGGNFLGLRDIDALPMLSGHSI